MIIIRNGKIQNIHIHVLSYKEIQDVQQNHTFLINMSLSSVAADIADRDTHLTVATRYTHSHTYHSTYLSCWLNEYNDVT